MKLFPRASFFAVLMWACVSLAAIGCGSSSSSPPPDYAKALRDAPAPLASLYSQGNQLLSGGEDAFEKRLETLRGYPVVVNIWASWCGGCIAEFPEFQKLSARFGTRVAFIGIDSFDDRDAAATLLREAPIPYPSYTDSDQKLARSFGTTGLPATVFFDRSGKVVFLKRGSYRDEEELRAEIERRSLGA